jgi:NarL family two-component system response regulator LiaR
MRQMYRGDSSPYPTISRRLIHEINRPSDLPPAQEPLTEREVEVLRLMAHGLCDQETSEILFVSERTVRTHVSNILSKLHPANRTRAALYALREGLVTLEGVHN